MHRTMMFIVVILLCNSSSAQNIFQIKNNKSSRTKSFKCGDKLIFKTTESDLRLTGEIDSIGSSFLIVSGAIIPFENLRCVISERKWRQRIRPLAIAGIASGSILALAGNFWLIAGVAGNPNFLVVGLRNIILGKTLRIASILPFVCKEGVHNIPDNWQIVN
ncbi:hypothetical protein N9R81_00735 [Flavobacteriales bacterium]|nr:hypothetical protein [Flavobacteriales bacterium]